MRPRTFHRFIFHFTGTWKGEGNLFFPFLTLLFFYFSWNMRSRVLAIFFMEWDVDPFLHFSWVMRVMDGVIREWQKREIEFGGYSSSFSLSLGGYPRCDLWFDAIVRRKRPNAVNELVREEVGHCGEIFMKSPEIFFLCLALNILGGIVFPFIYHILCNVIYSSKITF